MAKRNAATMTEEDWQNLRLQLRTLVDIYCKMNDEIVAMKMSMKAMIKHLQNVKYCKKGYKRAHKIRARS
jgi:hypothetical protein